MSSSTESCGHEGFYLCMPVRIGAALTNWHVSVCKFFAGVNNNMNYRTHHGDQARSEPTTSYVSIYIQLESNLQPANVVWAFLR